MRPAAWLVPLITVVLFSGDVLDGTGRTQRGTPRPAGTATVSGVVVESGTRNPIEFARLQLRTRVSNTSDAYLGEAAEDGTFTFKEVRAGIYFLAAQKIAYPPAFFSGSGPEATEPGIPITISDGQKVSGLILQMIPGGVISGRVVDAFDHRVPGVTVTATTLPLVSPPVSSPFYGLHYRATETDAHGNYRIYGLPPGDYVVRVSPTADATAMGSTSARQYTYSEVFFPNEIDPRFAAAVSVQSGGEQSGIDLRLRLVPLFKVAGIITGPNVSPYSLRLQFSSRSNFRLHYSDSGSVDKDRRFVTSGVASGDYWLIATTSIYPPPGAPAGSESQLWWAAVPINVTDTDVSNVVLTLQPAQVVSGQLLVEQSAATTVTTAIAKRSCLVSLTALPDTTPPVSSPVSVTPAADGQFRMANVAGGRYRVVVRTRTDGVDFPVASIEWRGQIFRGAEIEIPAGADVSGLIVRIKGG